MREKLAGITLVAAMLSASGSACAMSSADRQALRCEVIGGEKLPPASGGSAALCAAIERAVAEQAPGAAVRAEVRVLSPSLLSAILTTSDGRRLAEQKFAAMDHPLTEAAFQRFANAIAAELARSR